MLEYAVCEIAGKQYKVVPDKPFEIDWLRDDKDAQFINAKVLLFVEDGKLQLGKPYLKKDLELNILEKGLGEKIRVAKFHAKANFRKVKGHRAVRAKIVLPVKKTS